MSPRHRSSWPVLAALLLLALSASRAEGPLPAALFPDAPDPLHRLVPDQTPEQVRKLLGPPARISRQILSDHHREQWGYDRPQPVRLEFEFLRGQKARLRTGRRLQPTNP
jgi:hypothetical protein